MVVVAKMERLMSLDARGKFGFSAGCGMARCGYTKCGSSARFGGVYQRKKLATGWGVSRMHYYRPTNPQTVPQQAWRALMSDAWGAYALLTTDEKNMLSLEARRYRLSGPNLFVSRYLKAHTM